MNVSRLILAGVFCAAASAQLLVDVPPKPPADVDQALRERITAFYQAEKDGKFRQADQYVAEDSKDAFFEIPKSRPLSFDAPRIEYSDNFTKAKVVTDVETIFRQPRFGEMKVRQPIPSTWKLVDGKWYWYLDQSGPVNTPFGPAKVGKLGESNGSQPAGDQVIANMRAAVDHASTNPSSYMGSVKPDREVVDLDPAKPGHAEVVVTNGLQGMVTLSVAPEPFPGLKVSVENKVLKAGEKTKVIYHYAPGKTSPPFTVTSLVEVDPFGRFPIQVRFQQNTGQSNLMPAKP